MATQETNGAMSKLAYAMPVTAAKLAVVQLHRRGCNDREQVSSRMLNCVRLYSDLRFDGFASDELARIFIDVQSMSNERVGESHTLHDLNRRLASYLEQCRYYEVANRVLIKQLLYLRQSISSAADNTRGLYELEIENVTRLLEESQRRRKELQKKYDDFMEEKERLRDRKKQLKSEVKSYKFEIMDIVRQISERECRNAHLRRKLERAEMEAASLKAEIFRMRHMINTMNVDLDTESLNRMRAECKVHNLEEEITFSRLEWENLKREYDRLINTEVPPESRAFWNSEVNVMITALYNDFESRADALKLEFETRYNTRVREIQTQHTRDSIEYESLKVDLDRLVRAKNSLTVQLDVLEPTAMSMDKRMLVLREDYEGRIKRAQDEINLVLNQRSEAEKHIRKLYDEVQNLLKLKVTLEAELKRYRNLLDQREDKLRSPRTSDSNLIRIERRFETVTMRHEVRPAGRFVEQVRIHSESENQESKKLRVPRMAESAMWLSPPQVQVTAKQ